MSCTYCLPKGFPEWYRHKARLGLPEIKTVLRGFRQLGFCKVRFTGGEPTVHPEHLEALMAAQALGFEEIALTTNGLLITDMPAYLAAGLTQLNVSLDSLQPATFKAMTQNSGLAKVLATIDAALALGVKVKVNTVLLRSVNFAEAAALIDWALARPLTLRFIELMPTGLNRSFYDQEQVRGTELEPLLRQAGLEPVTTRPLFDTGGPESLWSGAARGRIGMINPLSCNFCHQCNRLRVTAKGALKLCLFGDDDLPLDLSSAETVAAAVRKLVGAKKERHGLEEGDIGNVQTFRTIGG